MAKLAIFWLLMVSAHFTGGETQRMCTRYDLDGFASNLGELIILGHCESDGPDICRFGYGGFGSENQIVDLVQTSNDSFHGYFSYIGRGVSDYSPGYHRFYWIVEADCTTFEGCYEIRSSSLNSGRLSECGEETLGWFANSKVRDVDQLLPGDYTPAPVDPTNYDVPDNILADTTLDYSHANCNGLSVSNPTFDPDTLYQQYNLSGLILPSEILDDFLPLGNGERVLGDCSPRGSYGALVESGVQEYPLMYGFSNGILVVGFSLFQGPLSLLDVFQNALDLLGIGDAASTMVGWFPFDVTLNSVAVYFSHQLSDDDLVEDLLCDTCDCYSFPCPINRLDIGVNAIIELELHSKDCQGEGPMRTVCEVFEFVFKAFDRWLPLIQFRVAFIITNVKLFSAQLHPFLPKNADFGGRLEMCLRVENPAFGILVLKKLCVFVQASLKNLDASLAFLVEIFFDIGFLPGGGLLFSGEIGVNLAQSKGYVDVAATMALPAYFFPWLVFTYQRFKVDVNLPTFVPTGIRVNIKAIFTPFSKLLECSDAQIRKNSVPEPCIEVSGLVVFSALDTDGTSMFVEFRLSYFSFARALRIILEVGEWIEDVPFVGDSFVEDLHFAFGPTVIAFEGRLVMFGTWTMYVKATYFNPSLNPTTKPTTKPTAKDKATTTFAATSGYIEFILDMDDIVIPGVLGDDILSIRNVAVDMKISFTDQHLYLTGDICVWRLCAFTDFRIEQVEPFGWTTSLSFSASAFGFDIIGVEVSFTIDTNFPFFHIHELTISIAGVELFSLDALKQFLDCISGDFASCLHTVSEALGLVANVACEGASFILDTIGLDTPDCGSLIGAAGDWISNAFDTVGDAFSNCFGLCLLSEIDVNSIPAERPWFDQCVSSSFETDNDDFDLPYIQYHKRIDDLCSRYSQGCVDGCTTVREMVDDYWRNIVTRDTRMVFKASKRNFEQNNGEFQGPRSLQAQYTWTPDSKLELHELRDMIYEDAIPWEMSAIDSTGTPLRWTEPDLSRDKQSARKRIARRLVQHELRSLADSDDEAFHMAHAIVEAVDRHESDISEFSTRGIDEKYFVDAFHAECGLPVPELPPRVTTTCRLSQEIQIVSSDIVEGTSCEREVTRTWTVFDACGTRKRWVQDIHIVDRRPPQFFGNIPDVISIPWCDLTVQQPIVKDLCRATPHEVIFKTDLTDETRCNGGQFYRTWTTSDSCGNENEMAQTVHVTSNVDVRWVTFPDDQIVMSSEIPYADEAGKPVAVNFCGSPIPQGTIQHEDAVQNNIVTRKWKATDACGNSLLESQIIITCDTLECQDCVSYVEEHFTVNLCKTPSNQEKTFWVTECLTNIQEVFEEALRAAALDSAC